MTAREVYLNALTLLGETDDSGAPKSAGEYEGKAIALLNLMLEEIGERTGVSAKIAALSDAVGDTLHRALTYGLAAAYALSDRDAELYAVLHASYLAALRALAFEPEGLPAAERLEQFNRGRLI